MKLFNILFVRIVRLIQVSCRQCFSRDIIEVTAIVKAFICHGAVLSKSVFVFPCLAKASCVYKPIKGLITGLTP